MLIQNADHKRDKATAVDKIQADLDEKLLYLATEFLESIRSEKSRYARDQFRIIETLIDKYEVDACLEAIEFCTRSRIFSAIILAVTSLSSSSRPRVTINSTISSKAYRISSTSPGT